LGVFIGLVKREVMGKEEYRIVGTNGWKKLDGYK